MCYKRLNRAQKDAEHQNQENKIKPYFNEKNKIKSYIFFIKIFYFKYKVWMLLTFQLAPINI